MAIPRFLFLGKRDEAYAAGYKAKAKLKRAKQKLVKTLHEQVEVLEGLIEGTGEKYNESGLAEVLLAAANYLQFLKLNPGKVGKTERVLLDYLSTANPQKLSFSSVCTNLYEQLKALPQESPMLKVKHNELLNAYVYLLLRLEHCRG